MHYDFLIIGGGSAGYAAARTTAALGLRVGVIDGAKELGGLCILRGCMPSKTLLASSTRFHAMQRAREFGLRASGLEVRGDEILERKRRLVREFAEWRQQQLEGGSFELVRGHARFVEAHTVEVTLPEGGRRTLTARAFLLATGSVVSEPPLASIREAGAWTSDDVLDSAQVPESIVILGGGAIAVEFATYYAGLGRETTMVQRSGQLLTETDADLAAAVENGLRARGVRIFTGTKLRDVQRVGEKGRERGKCVQFEQEGKVVAVEAEQVLNSLGRSPAIAGLALEAAGVKVERGRPVVRGTQQTSQPHIFAAGDVVGPLEVVHLAIQQGELAARNVGRLLAEEGEALEEMDYRLKLAVVFCDPEIAVCGASERELHERGTPFRVAAYPFNDHGKSMTMGETDGFVKLIAGTDGEILGAGVVGPQASELIHEIVVAMHFRGTAKQLASVPHFHPTLSEIWTHPAEELM